MTTEVGAEAALIAVAGVAGATAEGFVHDEPHQLDPANPLLPRLQLRWRRDRDGVLLTMIARGLIIDRPWIDLILAGRKTWELRSTGTRLREGIALIRKGSGRIVGLATITGVHGPLGREELLATRERHQVPESDIRAGKCDGWNHAWVLGDVRALPEPVPYPHPNGAVIWVRLPAALGTALAHA